MKTLAEGVEEKESVCLENIAVATDFSEASGKAFDYAMAIARHYGSKMYVVHAIPPESALLPQLSEDQRWCESQNDMEGFSSRSDLKEVTHELLLRAGSVWSVLSDVIRHENIDLLVLGTHGRGGLKRAVLGSVAEELVRLVRLPRPHGWAEHCCCICLSR